MSHFAVEVVPVKLEPHPNADALSLVQVYGYTVVVRTEDWQGIAEGAYIPPDSVVPVERPEYAFLEGKSRITVRRFRGVYSHGLLMPAPEGAKLGDDVAAVMGVTHYEPPLRSSGGLSTYGSAEVPPAGDFPVYDIEHYRRHTNLLAEGEPVAVTEKIHGANARFTVQAGRFRAGSRNEWKRADMTSIWWRVYDEYPQLDRFLRANPDLTVYGEVYGDVQDLRYGLGKGEVAFAAFDIYRQPRPRSVWRRFADRIAGRLGYVPARQRAFGSWVPFKEAYELAKDAGIPWVPLLAVGPFEPAMLALADGPSTIEGAGHIREGCVIRPLAERHHPAVGRVQLKLVSDAYLERAK